MKSLGLERSKASLYPWLIVLMLAFSFFGWNYSVIGSGLLEHNLGYVSDDVWYVSSGRNMLREFWKVTPHAMKDGKEYATVVAFDEISESEALEILQKFEGFSLVKDDYEKPLDAGYSNAFAVLAPEEAYKTLEAEDLRVKVYRGYPYPDETGIINYMNFEHPPLAKYVLALVMLVDDSPLAWRFPSLILGSTVIFLVFVVARKIFGSIPGIVASVFLFTDKTVRSMSMVAMLDIYTSFLTLLALYFAVSKRSMAASSLTAGLAGATKFTGFSASMAILVSFRKRRKIMLILFAFVIPMFVYLFMSLPVIFYLGDFQRWATELLTAVRWQVSPKPSGPPTVNPVELFLGSTGFPLSYAPPVSASVNFILTSMTIPATILLAPLALKGKIEGGGTLLAWFWSTYFIYLAVYLAGNTTLYAFYAVQFAPLAAVLASFIIFLIFHPEQAVELLNFYKSLLKEWGKKLC